MKKLNHAKNERGQSLAEYTIILSLIGVAALAGTAYLGASIKAKISALTGTVAGVSSADINQEEEKSQKAFQAASQSSSQVSGMKIETKGNGKEVIDSETLK